MLKTFFAAATAVAIVAPAYAQDDSSIAHDGLRLEVRAGIETPTVSDLDDSDDLYKLGSAVAFGVEAGFDVAVSNTVVVGPYVNYDISTVKSCDGNDCGKAVDNIAAGLHVGVALNEKGQIYGKVGYSRLKLEFDVPSLNLPPVSDSGDGVGFALGYEHSFGKSFYGRIEGSYADNGTIFGLKWQRRYAGISLGTRF